MVYATHWIIRGLDIRDSKRVLKRDSGLFLEHEIQSDWFEPDGAQNKLLAIDKSFLKRGW